jgi:RHS repeat-associated protein
VESTKNERGYETRNYFDKLGRLVLRKVQVKETFTNLNDSLQWAQTYFVYDDFNRLRFVLQPELVKSLVRTNVDPSPVQLSNLAFIYRYDERGREIVKKMPGADSVFQVYDLRNRLVMRQNGTQRNLNQWEFLKYDALNRIIISGIYTHTGSLSQAAMSALISRTEFFESYSGSSTNHGYTNVVFPMERADILQVRYYDDYRFRSLWPASFGYLNDALTSATNGATYTQAVSSLVYQRGNVTGIKSRIVGGSDFIKTVYYYDQKNNVTQSIQDVFVNGINAGTERTSSLYDFTGRLLRSRITHRAGLPEQRLVNKRFEYDHAGRLINSWLQLDGRPEILIRQNKWNELDQLTDVKLHSTDKGISFRQSIDYRYNIRGWVSSVNNASLIADGVTNDDANDLFGLNILYESADVSLNNTPDFSGNVSTIRWSINQGKSVEKERAYRFNYDPMDRLKTTEMFSNKSGWLLTSANREDGIAYDLNGNLVTLRRTDENGVTQDQLRYLYGSGANYGNKLLSVQDSGDPLSGFLDVQTSMDYTYNAVGNLTIDRNSKISGIEYNYLDLPSVLTDENGLRQKNFYDAGGRKVRSEYYGSSGHLLKATDFTGALIYEQGTLNRYEHEDGRILYNNYRYQYFLKDHQNNVRLTFDADPETKTAIATFELSAATLEQTQFLRINSVKRIYSTLLDRTNGASPGYSIRLSGASNERYGPAKSIQVFPGDEFRAEVFAKYLDKNQSSWSASLTTLVAQIISGTAGVVQEGSSFSTSTSSFPFAGLLSSGATDAAPMAYLNWLVFDKNYKFIPSVSGYVRLSTAAREYGQDVAFEKLISPLIKITEPGYVYIYLSNEESQPVEVYFDDFTVSHFRSPVVQMNDYLPMGNTFNTFERDDVQEQILKFNSKPVDNFFSFILADFGRRNYALTAGRFFLQDRFQEKYFGMSPYQHAANNPLKFSDHQGDSIIQVTIRDQSGYIKGNNVLFIDHTLYGDLKGLLNDAIETQTYIHLNSSFRTVARQRQLYQDLRAISPAEAGRSAHNAGLAVDFNVFVNNDPSQGLDPGNTSLNSDHPFIARVKERQWRFGGDFKSPDKIHLDKRESVGNFSELVGSNQRQVDGYRMLRVPEERIKRKEIIELNK